MNAPIASPSTRLPRVSALTTFGLYFRTGERHVAPQIEVEVEGRSGRGGDRDEQRDEAVGRLDLGGVGIEFLPERFDEGRGETLTAAIRVRGEVRVVVAQ